MPFNLLENIKNKDQLSWIAQPAEDDFVYLDTQELHIFRNGKWQSVDELLSKPASTIYDMNKMYYNSLPKMKTSDIKEKSALFADYMKHKANQYYIFMNNELRYFTLFTEGTNETRSFISKLQSCLQALRADVLSIELSENGQAIEIWVRIDKTVYMFPFFAYDMGVVKYANDLL